MKRDCLLSFRTSEYENKVIKSKASAIQSSVSTYVRTAAMDKEIIHIDGLRECIPQLNQMGNNLNQIAVLLRMGKITNPYFDQLCRDFSGLVEAIYTRLRK